MFWSCVIESQALSSQLIYAILSYATPSLKLQEHQFHLFHRPLFSFFLVAYQFPLSLLQVPIFVGILAPLPFSSTCSYILYILPQHNVLRPPYSVQDNKTYSYFICRIMKVTLTLFSTCHEIYQYTKTIQNIINTCNIRTLQLISGDVI